MDIREALDRLICVLFPPRCLNCNEVVCYGDMFCEKCGYKRANAESCHKKLHDVPVSGVVAGTLFTGSLMKAVYTIKDRQDVRIRNFFADTMLEEINNNWTGFAFDYVTPVPLSPDKLKKRGFNQAGLLAKELAKLLKVPYVDNALAKENNSQIQHTLNSRQRKENARKSFRAADPELINGKTILLVDDVLTTGATLRTCASLLFDAGAKAVYIAAASSTPDFKPSTYIPEHTGADINRQAPVKEIDGSSIVVGFTGHRQYKLGINQDEASPECIALKKAMSALLDRLIQEYGVTKVLVGLAMGTDIWMAEIVIEKMKDHPSLILECAIPFKNQTQMWSRRTKGQFLQRYNDILSHENVISDGYTPASEYIEGCYQERNLYIIHQCDVLLAVFNGKPSGTGNTVRAAQRLDKNYIIIDPLNLGVLVDK